MDRFEYQKCAFQWISRFCNISFPCYISNDSQNQYCFHVVVFLSIHLGSRTLVCKFVAALPCNVFDPPALAALSWFGPSTLKLTLEPYS